MHKLIVTIFIITTHPLLSQPALRDLEKYMTDIRRDPSLQLPASILADNRNEDKLITYLLPYFSDSVSTVRSKAYYIEKRIAQKSSNTAVRDNAITQLIKAIRDKDTGISGNANEALTGFRKNDFTATHKDSIASLLDVRTPHVDVLFRLAGYLDMQNQRGKLNDIINSSTSFKNKWAARLALARMGDQGTIDYINGKLSNAPVNDDFVYDVVPDIIYTRQKQLFDFLVQIINSDKADCQPANADSNQKILCGYRVMEYLAPVIENFPISLDESGDLNTSNYPTALSRVRTWFTSHHDYAIRNNTF